MDWELSVMLGAVVLALSILAGTVTYENSQDNDAMVAMVSKGWSPVQARCAVKGMTDSMCANQTKK